MKLSPIERHDVLPSSVKVESRDCPLCGSGNTAFVLQGFDRLHGLPGTFTIVRCTGCGLMRTNPRPTSDTIGFYYPDDYGPYRNTRVERDQPVVVSSGWKRAVRRLMDTRSMMLPTLPPGKMLEIGCASGSFLAEMERKGWSAEGVEFSSTAAQAARDAGLNVFSGSIDQAPLQEHAYDLIVAWMVVEHLHDPVAALKQLRKAAKPEAVLAFSVPNAASVDFRLLAGAGYALHLPAHLFHFTPKTIRKVLEASGWRIERVIHQRSVVNFLAGVGNAIADRNPRSRIGLALQQFPERTRWQDVLFPVAYLLSLVGQTGRMTIWARRA